MDKIMKMRVMKLIEKDHKIWASPDPKSINKMINLFLKMMFQDIFLRMGKYIPWTQGMCHEAVRIESRSLAFIPDHFKTQAMCNEAVEQNLYTLKFVPDQLKTQEMCKRASEKYLHPMNDVLDHPNT